MKHGHTSRNYVKAFFAFAALAMVGACSDQGALVPAEQIRTIKAPANFSVVGSPVTFRVNNSEGITETIGSHVINIPAGAICDLAESYGATEWDQPCQPLNGSVVITATELQDGDGQPYIDFQPAMRFVPTSEVMLFFRTAGSTDSMLEVKYCNELGYCYDESLTDASLKPFRVAETTILGRRVKHFSGYFVGIGAGCGDEGCDEQGIGGMTRRSGYMVASGQDVQDVMDDKANGKKRDEM